MLLHFFTQRSRSTNFLLRQGRYIRRRRRRRSSQKVLQHPLAASHHGGPGGIRRHRQDRTLRQDPAALGTRQFDPPELLSLDPFDSVVSGQRTVQITERRIDEVENATVLAKHCRDEEIGLLF